MKSCKVEHTPTVYLSQAKLRLKAAHGGGGFAAPCFFGQFQNLVTQCKISNQHGFYKKLSLCKLASVLNSVTQQFLCEYNQSLEIRI